MTSPSGRGKNARTGLTKRLGPGSAKAPKEASARAASYSSTSMRSVCGSESITKLKGHLLSLYSTLFVVDYKKEGALAEQTSDKHGRAPAQQTRTE